MTTNNGLPEGAFDFSDEEEEKDPQLLQKADDTTDAEDAKFIRTQKNRKALKIGGITGGLAVGAAAVVVGILVFNPFGGFQTVGTAGPGSASADKDASTTPADVAYTNKALDWWQQPGSIYPVEVQDWQLQDFKKQDASTLRGEILAKQASVGLDSMGTALPSEAAGYTSNLDEVTNDEGVNPLFSYWTDEVFRGEVGTYMERILNPRFGGWEQAQYLSKSFTGEGYADMFTTRWNAAEGASAQNYPMYIDWTDSDYGLSGTLLDTGARWMGEVTNADVEFTYDEASGQYKAHLVANVKYTAWTVDQTSIEKTGVLTLDLVANPEQANGPSSNRVLIDSAKLEVN